MRKYWAVLYCISFIPFIKVINTDVMHHKQVIACHHPFSTLTCRSQQCQSFILSKWKKFTCKKYVLLKLDAKYIFYFGLETVKHKLLPENGYCMWKELWILFSFLCCTVGQVKADCNVCKDNPNKLCKHCACHKVCYLIS